MTIYPLAYEMAVKLHVKFLDLIGKPIDAKSLPNAIIEKVYIDKLENNMWTVKLFAYDKLKHLGFNRHLVNYIIEELPEFDIQQYGVTLHKKK